MSTKEPKKIVNTDRTDNKIIVSYSDESTAVFSSEQLEEITPTNVILPEQVEDPSKK
jgi:hypothetical protein